jgi:hypothetical protein
VGLAGLGDAEIFKHVLQKPFEGQGRVEDECRRGIAVQAAEQGAQERRLPRADFARQENESLVLLDSV